MKRHCKFGRTKKGTCRKSRKARRSFSSFGADFQRRHYEAVARILSSTSCDQSAVESFIDMFKADNPRFDASRFRRAVHG